MATATACASGKAATAPAGVVSAANDTVGRFVWHDLVTNDTAASQKFYAALLGWEFEPTTRNGRPYVIARSGGQPTGGIVQRQDGKTGPATWLAYLSVADLDRALGQVTSAGGKVLLPPTAVGAYGRVAVVLDPEGAPLGLAGVTGTLRSGAGPAAPPRVLLDGAPREGRPGGARLLQGPGRIREQRLHERARHRVPRAEASALTRGPAAASPELEGVQPNWLPYVRVEDPAALAAKAVTLGGRVVIEPRADVRKGTLAVIVDPTGAALALQKWPL